MKSRPEPPSGSSIRTLSCSTNFTIPGTRYLADPEVIHLYLGNFITTSGKD